MGCTSTTTHEFAEGATTCRCGKARTVERTVMEPPLTPVRCFVCGGSFDGGKLAGQSERGPHHAACNPARVCKCGALAPEGKIWASGHICGRYEPCKFHRNPYCFDPDPLCKPARRTFTVAEVKGLSEEALVKACAEYVLQNASIGFGLIDWSFAMACRDAAVRRTKPGAVGSRLFTVSAYIPTIETATAADFASAALLAVAGEGVK